MADTSRTVEIIFRGNNQLSGAIGGVTGELDDIEDSAQGAQEGVDGLGDELSDFGGYAGGIKLAATAMAALATSVVAARFSDANANYESFIKAITFSTGSLEKAGEEWEFVSDLANKYGVELGSLSDTYIKFTGQVQGSNVEGERAREIFSAVTGSISAMGGSTADVSGALLQMGQGISRNRFELDDLKGVVEKMPGGIYGFAEALGVSTDEVFKMVTAQEVGAEAAYKYAKAQEESLVKADFSTVLNEYRRVDNAVDEIAISLGKLGINEALADRLRIVRTILEEINELLEAEASQDLFNVAAEGAEELAKTVVGGRTGGSVGLVVSILEYTGALDKAKEAAKEAFGIGQLEEVEVKVKRVETALYPFIDQLKEVDVQGERFAGTITNLDGAISDIEKSSKAAGDQMAKMAKIAADLEIAKIEGFVDINVAQIEADSRKAVAAIEGLATTIEGTADLLGGLFDNLLDAENFRQEFAIEDQIEIENERRQQQLDQQERLNNALIKEMNARTKALERGQAFIEIDGAGLQPHLEAFMFEILEQIQTKVNADGYEYLLGAGV